MDVSHFVVVGFTVVAIVFLVWAELRSRRNVASQAESASVSLPESVEVYKQAKRRRR